MPQSGGTTYYVATSGSDSNTGSQAQPFLTIQRAANLVNPGDTVVVADGIYTGSSPVLSISRSGTRAPDQRRTHSSRSGVKTRYAPDRLAAADT